MYQESKYSKAHKKRIIIFIAITGVYLLFSATYTITGLFITIPWSDNKFLYAYCLYAIWFNAYTYYRYHRNSVEEERKEQRDTDWQDFYRLTKFAPFNHKKARRHIFLLTSLAIAVNVALMVVTKWVWQ